MENECQIIIKNMVCNRCIMAVESLFRKEGVRPLSIELSRVTLASPLTDAQAEAIKHRLTQMGFEWVEDRKRRLVELIRSAVIEYVRMENEDRPLVSDYLEQRCAHEYSMLSKLFTEVQGCTIERYQIRQKVERVKELLFFDQLTVSEIAYRVGYSSVAHLSNQFKAETGMTPTQFKQIKESPLTNLDEI